MISYLYDRIKNYLLNWPLITWILLGFFITFIKFFVSPIFFHPSLIMQFNKYIVDLAPIGHDFLEIVSFSSTWFQTGDAPPILYPPFILIFFTPFTFLDYETSYKILTLITIICYILITFLVPQWISKSKEISPFTMLIFITGITSYGFQFELERGQWNIIAFSFSLVAIYIFHNRPTYRWLAYLLFTISVQLKIYPAIFVFALIENWSDWRNNIKRVAGLGILNILAIFILGLSPIQHTIESLVGITSSQAHIGGALNHSITSFTIFFLSKKILPHKLVILWLLQNNWLPQLFLFAFFGFCFLVIILHAYTKKISGFNPYLFLGCSIGACIIPSISFDYKLSVLPACIAICIPGILSYREGENRVLNVLLALIFSIAYSSTLYSYVTKPEIIQNNFPALLLMLVICVLFSYIRSDKAKDII